MKQKETLLAAKFSDQIRCPVCGMHDDPEGKQECSHLIETYKIPDGKFKYIAPCLSHFLRDSIRNLEIETEEIFISYIHCFLHKVNLCIYEISLKDGSKIILESYLNPQQDFK